VYADKPDLSTGATLKVLDLTFAYGLRQVLKQLSFVARPGEMIALLGPNGVGKSTLMRCVLGFEQRFLGSILIGGSEVRELAAKKLAQQVAYIPQSSAQVFDFTVGELVLMGASPRLGLFATPGKDEVTEATAVLESLGIAHLIHRGCGQISGGEYQLALLARALLQKAQLLLMDEPTASLDYGNQYRVMERIAGLTRRNFAVLFSAHDPNQVLRHATRVLVLAGGRLIADGPPAKVMDSAMLSGLYGIDVRRYHVGGHIGGQDVGCGDADYSDDSKQFEVCVPYGSNKKIEV
jgi:iron complex transport system ATP-binding protein